MWFQTLHEYTFKMQKILEEVISHKIQWPKLSNGSVLSPNLRKTVLQLYLFIMLFV